MKLTLSPGTLCYTRIMFNEHIRNQSFPLQTRAFIKALGTSLELGSAPEKESQSRGISLWSPLFEASHCSPYRGQEAGNSGEDCWRGPHPVSIGDNALGHIVTHDGGPRILLQAKEEGTLSFPGLPTPVAPSQPSEKMGVEESSLQCWLCVRWEGGGVQKKSF